MSNSHKYERDMYPPNFCKLIDGTIVNYHAASKIPNYYDPENFVFIGYGIIYSVNGHIQHYSLDNPKDLEYFWKRK